MKIDIIFDKKLYSIVRNNEDDNELRRLIQLWNDVDFLYQFYKKNKTYFKDPFFGIEYTSEDFLNDINSDLERLENFIEKISYSDDIDSFFIELSKEENNRILSINKKQFKLLRLYAVKIEDHIYIIVGGAIKITKKMQAHSMTNNCLHECEYCRAKLFENRITTSTKLNEFIINNYKL